MNKNYILFMHYIIASSKYLMALLNGYIEI